MKVKCPSCGISLDGTDDLVGQKVECPNCGAKWVVASEVNAEQYGNTQSLSGYDERHGKKSYRVIACIAVCVLAVLLCADIGVRLATKSVKAAQKNLNSGDGNVVASGMEKTHAPEPVAPKWDEVVDWLRDKAESGNTDAQVAVGSIALKTLHDVKLEDRPFKNKEDTLKQMTEAIKWYRMAAEKNDLAAINALGVCYYRMATNTRRYHDDRDEVEFSVLRRGYAREAMKCFRLAIGARYPDALYNLHVLFGYGHQYELEQIWRGAMGHDSERVLLLQMAAEKGHTKSLLTLAHGFEEGSRDYTKDQAAADRYYEEAKKSGLVYARGNYAIYKWERQFGYRDCLLWSEENAETVKSMRKKAEDGDAGAQYAIGQYYQKGSILKKDLVEATRWYRKSADQGLPVAQCALGVCYYDGVGMERDMTEAFKWFYKAAYQGNEEAKKYLGICYYGGLGVKRDAQEAIRWLREGVNEDFTRNTLSHF